MGGDRLLNEALKLQVAKAAAGPPVRRREVPTGTRPPPAERRRNGRPVCWQCGNAGHLSRDCRRRPALGKRVRAGVKRGTPRHHLQSLVSH
jgi:hypothetical protein